MKKKILAVLLAVSLISQNGMLVSVSGSEFESEEPEAATDENPEDFPTADAPAVENENTENDFEDGQEADPGEENSEEENPEEISGENSDSPEEKAEEDTSAENPSGDGEEIPEEDISDEENPEAENPEEENTEPSSGENTEMVPAQEDTEESEELTSSEEQNGTDQTKEAEELELSSEQEESQTEDGKKKEEASILEESLDDGKNQGMIAVLSSDLTYGDFKYRLDSGNVTITGYTGKDSSVTIPAEIENCPVTSIADRAFEGCSFLNTLNLPEGLKQIGGRFIAGTGIRTITIPSTVTGTNTIYNNGWYDGATAGADYLEEIQFADGMKKIPDYFCSNGKTNISLWKITIPASVTEIGSYAFRYCAIIPAVNFGKTLTKIGGYAFGGCNNLEEITFENNDDMVMGSDGKKYPYRLEIDSYAFDGCSNLKSVTFSKNLKRLGTSVFNNCESLENLVLPEGLERIGYSFIAGTGITSLTIPTTVSTIDHNSQAGATNKAEKLKEIRFAEGATRIPSYICSNENKNKALKTIVIPSSVTTIDSYAFYNNAGLESVDTGSGTEKIEFEAFGECESLQSVTLNKNLKRIDRNVFYNCKKLENLNLPEGLEHIGGCFIAGTGIRSLTISGTVTTTETVYNNGWYEGAIAGATQLEELRFADGMKKIPDYFCSNSNKNLVLENIIIPSSVTEIGSFAFRNCAKLFSLNMGKKITKVGDYAFWGCNNLETITFEDNDEMVMGSDGKKHLYSLEIRDNAFRDCSSLMNVTLSKNLKILGSQVFYACESLENLSLPEGLERIGYSFIAGTGITSLTIPTTVSTIVYSGQAGATNKAEKLREIRFAEGTTRIPSYICSNENKNKALKAIDIPSSVTTIDSYAFYNNTGLERVDTGSGTEKIEFEVFGECESLQTVTLNKNLKRIDRNVFYNCKKLENLNLPEGLEHIGGCFIAGTGIRSLTIPSTVATTETVYNNGWYEGPIAGAGQLEELRFADGMKKIPDYFCSNSNKNLVLESIIIPSSVTEIGSFAFRNCAKLFSLNMGKKITKVGSYAFWGCNNLETITFEDNDEMVMGSDGKKHLYSLEISDNAFRDCSSLMNVTFSKNLKTLGSNVFYACESLENLSLPEGLEKIGYSFIAGTKVNSLTIPTTVVSVGHDHYDGATTGASNLTEIRFSEGMKRIPDYLCSSNSKNLSLQRIVMPSSITEIGSHAFRNCSALEQINLGKELSRINDYAFYGCNNLETVTFEDNDKMVMGSDGRKKLYSLEIGDSVFQDCESLTNVTLSKNISGFGTAVFAGCGNLNQLVLPDNLSYIGSDFIMETGITSLTVPASVTRVNYTWNSGGYDGATAKAPVLRDIIFSDGLKTIPDYFCSSGSENNTLKRAVIPASVTSIGNSTFYNCKNLTIYGARDSYAEVYAEQKGIPFAEITTGKITRYDSAKTVMDQFPSEHLLNNITLKNGKITGPQIKVAGKTFNLFEIDAGMDLKLGDKVQTKINMDTKTVEVLIGFKDFSGSANISGEYNGTDSYWSKSYQEVKNLYTGMTGKKVDSTKLWNDFSKLRGNLKQFDMKMAVNGKAYAAGYMEFSFASGDFEFQEGGIVLETSLGTTLNYQVPAFPAAYCTFSLNSDFKGNLQLAKKTEVNYSLSMAAQLNLAARMGIGLGIKKANNYVEGGYYGKLKTSVKLPASSLEEALTVYLNGGLYIESRILGFDGPDYDTNFDDVQIYPSVKTYQAFDGKDVADLSEFQVPSAKRDYLDPEEQPLDLDGNKNIQGSIFEKTGSYPYSEPNLAELADGTKLMVWIDDNGTKNTVNRTSLMASVYKNGEWSEPESLYETGGLNDYPDVYTDGTAAYIVWQRTAAPLSENATLEEALKATNLYCITYRNGQFSEPQLLGNSSNESYEMLQRITADGTRTTVAWVENSENDPFMAAGTNTVKISVNQNGSWKEETLVSDVAAVSGMDISYVNGSLAVLYETYGEEDNTLHLVYKGKTKNIAGNNGTITDGVLYYTKEDTACTYDIVSGKTISSVMEGVDNFAVVSGNHIRYLLTLKSDGYGNELYASLYDEAENTWGNAVAVTDYGKYIRSYSPQLDSDGNLTVAMNAVSVDKNGAVSDEAEILVARFDAVKDIAVSGLTYDETMVTPGGILPLSFTVTNNSLVSVSKFMVTLADENGIVLDRGEIDSHIEPGNTAEATFNYQLPEELSLHKITLTASVEGDSNTENNSQTISVGYGNLVMTNLHLSGSESKPYLSGILMNNGYGDVENVHVSVYQKNAAGEVLGTYTGKNLAPGEQTSFSVEIPAVSVKVSPTSLGNVFYVKAETDSMETNVEDNSSYFLVDDDFAEEVSLNYTELSMEKGETRKLEVAYTGNASVSGKSVVWSSSNKKAAVVDSEGEVTALWGGNTVITAKIGNVSASCKVTVSDTVAVAGITLESQSVKLTEGDTYKLKASVLPENATNQNIKWKTSDEKILSVDENGTILAISPGTAQVTATTEDGEKQSSCMVSVVKNKETEYTAEFQAGDGTGTAPDHIQVPGGTRILLPDNTFIREGYSFRGWSDGNGVYQPGFQYRMPYSDITFTAQWRKNREISGTRKYEVKEGDEEFWLDAAISEGTGILEYTSSDHKVATSDTSGKITIHGEGKTVIHIQVPATEEYESAEADVEIVVSHNYSFVKKISDATALLAKQELWKCTVCGKTETRTVGKPLNATYKLNMTSVLLMVGQSTTAVKISGLAKGDSIAGWSSENTSIVRVDRTGKITAQKKAGKTRVRITLRSGKNVYVNVTVQKTTVKTTRLSGLSNKLTLKKGQKQTLKPVRSPVTAGEKITYASSNQKIVAVTSSGVLTAKGAGTAKITVRSGSVRVIVTVTVPKTATKSIKGVPSTKVLKKGQSYIIKPKLTPAASDDRIQYQSSNKKIATVDSKGKVTAKQKGTVVITVKSGTVAVKCKITVK